MTVLPCPIEAGIPTFLAGRRHGRACTVVLLTLLLLLSTVLGATSARAEPSTPTPQRGVLENGPAFERGFRTGVEEARNQIRDGFVVLYTFDLGSSTHIFDRQTGLPTIPLRGVKVTQEVLGLVAGQNQTIREHMRTHPLPEKTRVYNRGYETGMVEADQEIRSGAPTMYTYGIGHREGQKRPETGLPLKVIAGEQVDAEIQGRTAGHNDRIRSHLRSRQ